MLVTIDIGNSNVVLGVFDDKGLKAHQRFPTVKDASVEHYTKLFSKLVDREVPTQGVDGVAIASVVPSLNPIFDQLTRQLFGNLPLFVSYQLRTGLTYEIDNPATLGADRLANATAAFDLYGGPSIVVDAGTAVTYEVIDEDGAFLGGAISPGIGISYDALITKASLLTKVPLRVPQYVIGKNTQDNIQSGLVYGFASMIDGMVTKIEQELGIEEAIVIGTGGFSELVASQTESFTHVNPNLTLEGLRIIWEKNRL